MDVILFIIVFVLFILFVKFEPKISRVETEEEVKFILWYSVGNTPLTLERKFKILLKLEKC